MKEQEELELPGKRPFFNAAHQFYMGMHTGVWDNQLPQVETWLCT